MSDPARAAALAYCSAIGMEQGLNILMRRDLAAFTHHLDALCTRHPGTARPALAAAFSAALSELWSGEAARRRGCCG